MFLILDSIGKFMVWPLSNNFRKHLKNVRDLSNKHSTGETAEIRKQKPLDAFLCKLFIKRKDMLWGIMIPGSDDITARQKYFNPKWPPFRDKSEMKREESNLRH